MKPQKDAACTSLPLSDTSLSGPQTSVSSTTTFRGFLSILPVSVLLAQTLPLLYCAIQVR